MRTKCGLALVLGVLLPLNSAAAQDPSLILADGGLQFPDGTVQLTAAAKGYAPVEDTGQKECWDQDGNPITCCRALHFDDGCFQAGVDWPSPRFTNNLNGTVTDNLTGLIWLQDAECFGTKTWEGAIQAVTDLALGSIGCSNYPAQFNPGWRLANVKELTSLIDHGEQSPALPVGHPFIDVQSSWYWSSSSYVPDPTGAWFALLSDGFVYANDKGSTYYVWPVRGGQ